jgi:hypothetical protein
LSKAHQKCKRASKVHLLRLVKFTNVSQFLLKKLRKSTLENPKIYVFFLAPKSTSFGDSGLCPGTARNGAGGQLKRKNVDLAPVP